MPAAWPVIYITKAKAKINILSKTKGSREYRLFVQGSQFSVTTLPRPLVGWKGGGI